VVGLSEDAASVDKGCWKFECSLVLAIDGVVGMWVWLGSRAGQGCLNRQTVAGHRTGLQPESWRFLSDSQPVRVKSMRDFRRHKALAGAHDNPLCHSMYA
jgi:hypothetical protein